MIEEELYEVQRDLAQARDLLHDAVDQLTRHFTRVVELVDAEGVQPVAAGRVRDAVGAAVVALQFQDLIDQLLGHAVKRLDAVASAQGAAAGADLREPAALWAGGRAGPKPVAQLRLEPGDVELF